MQEALNAHCPATGGAPSTEHCGEKWREVTVSARRARHSSFSSTLPNPPSTEQGSIVTSRKLFALVNPLLHSLDQVFASPLGLKAYQESRELGILKPILSSGSKYPTILCLCQEFLQKKAKGNIDLGMSLS